MLDVFFSLSFLPPSFAFLASFFPFSGYLVGFILVGEVFGNSFRGKWNKILMEIFGSMLQGFFPFSPLSLTELCLFWYGLKDLFTLHILAEPLKLVTS